MSDATAPLMNRDLRQYLERPVQKASAPRVAWSSHGVLLIELAVALIVAAASCGLLMLSAGAPGDARSFSIGLLAACLYLALSASNPERALLRSRRRPGHDVALATGTVLVVDVCWALMAVSRSTTLADLVTGSLWVAVAALATAAVSYGVERSRECTARVAVVGDRRAVALLCAAIGEAGHRRGYCVVAGLSDSASDLRLLLELVGSGSVDAIVLAIPPGEVARLSTICRALADSPVRICLGLEPASLRGTGRIARGSDLALVELWCNPQAGIAQACKRIGDVIGSLLLLTALAPLLLLVAVLIRIETPGPVLFRQWRFGLGSVPFVCFKFRTMDARMGDPTGALRTQRRDPRVTRVGRFLRRTSLDELPQLLNVLRGEMSLVGPRPHPMHMRVGSEYYFDAVPDYRLRHRVKPGITGWAQVNGSRGEVATLAQARKRVELDVEYVRNWSLATDARILASTMLGGFITAAD